MVVVVVLVLVVSTDTRFMLAKLVKLAKSVALIIAFWHALREGSRPEMYILFVIRYP